jgi:hypothetical protein
MTYLLPSEGPPALKERRSRLNLLDWPGSLSGRILVISALLLVAILSKMTLEKFFARRLRSRSKREQSTRSDPANKMPRSQS